MAIDKTPSFSADLVSLVGEYLDSNNDFLTLTHSCEVTGAAITNQTSKRRATALEEIKKLVGELRWVEPGSMIAGPSEIEYRLGNELPKRFVEFKEGFFMPVDDVTVGNYNYALGLPIDPTTEKKPMRGLTVNQWKDYVKLLNNKMADLWTIAFGIKIPEFKIPGKKELDYLEYAASTPTTPHKAKNPQSKTLVTVTAEHSIYSGINQIIRWNTLHTRADLNQLKRYVVFGQNRDAGPANVDSTFPNERGFRNLTGNIRKLIDIPYYSNYPGSDSPRLTVGGSWHDPAGLAQVASCNPVNVDDASEFVGLRLVAY